MTEKPFFLLTTPYLIQDEIPSPLTLPSEEGITTLSSLTDGEESRVMNFENESIITMEFSIPTLSLEFVNELLTVSIDSQNSINNRGEEMESNFGLFHSTRIPFKIIGAMYIMGLSFGILNSIPKTQNENFTLISVLLNAVASMLILTKLYLKRQEDQVYFMHSMQSRV